VGKQTFVLKVRKSQIRKFLGPFRNSKSANEEDIWRLTHYQEVGMGKQTFVLKVRKPQISKFLGSFRNRKSANFLGVPVNKSQLRNYLQNTVQLCLTVLKIIFANAFY
jgi:hypothetical protein